MIPIAMFGRHAMSLPSRTVPLVLLSLYFISTSTTMVLACCRSCALCSRVDSCPSCLALDHSFPGLTRDQRDDIASTSVQNIIHRLKSNPQLLTLMKHQKQLINITTEQTRVFTDRFRNMFRNHVELSHISSNAMSAVFFNLTTDSEFCRGRIMYSAPLLGLDRNSDIIQIFQFIGTDRMQWIMGEYCRSGSGSTLCENTLYPEFTPAVGINLDRRSIGVWWIWTNRCFRKYS